MRSIFWDEIGGRLGGTRAHLEDGDLDGDDGARLVLGPGVVLLAEHHDVHALACVAKIKDEKGKENERGGVSETWQSIERV